MTNVVIKADEFFVFASGIADDDLIGINIFYDAIAFGVDEHPGILSCFLFDTVPTIGDSVTSRGTAWRIMFDP